MTDPDHLATELAAIMTKSFGGPARVSRLERLKGGYSRRMWAFDAEHEGATSAWILCTDAADGVVGKDSLTRGNEAALLRHLHGTPVPTPAVAAVGSGIEPFGAEWFVMQRRPGTAAVGPLVRDPAIVSMRSRLGHQMARILADLHRASLPEAALSPIPAADDVALLEMHRWAAALAETNEARTPIMEDALRWLDRNAPGAPDRVCVVHGDYRTGNVLYDRSGITAVLDWEMAHAGDPLEDVAWAQLACWRVGTGLVGAVLSDDEWIAAYESASRRRVPLAALRWWQALGGVKMSVLAWRAVERTPPGKEHELLRRLFDQLQTQLTENLR